MKIFDSIREALKDKEVKIVLPEGKSHGFCKQLNAW